MTYLEMLRANNEPTWEQMHPIPPRTNEYVPPAKPRSQPKPPQEPPLKGPRLAIEQVLYPYDARLFIAIWMLGSINAKDVSPAPVQRLINAGYIVREHITEPWYEHGPMVSTGQRLRLSKAGRDLAQLMFKPRPHSPEVLLLEAPKIAGLLTAVCGSRT